MSQVEEIKDRLDIVDFISTYVPLKKAGRYYKGLCPFHAEKTPSFVVYPETANWHCFGACGTGGDIYSFIMKKENLDFSEALRFLADKAGVVLKERRLASRREDAGKESLFEIMGQAASYYSHLLLTSSQGKKAWDYLEGRSLHRETIETFQLGYAPDQWTAIHDYMTTKGCKTNDLLRAGLIMEREGGGYYDRFRNRLMIPIRDRRGRTIAFGARSLDGSEPKYLNSPQTELFEKSRLLFGLDRSVKGIRERGEAVIVEGYMDVLMAHQHDIDNVVACMGTSVTEEQLKDLSRLTSKITLALDPDVAGDAATLRSLQMARVKLLRSVPGVSLHGQLQEKKRLLVDLRVVSLPAGMDPDDLIRQGIEHWEEMLRGSRPIAHVIMDHACKGKDLSDPAEKSRAVQDVVPLLRVIPDDVERQVYIHELARRVRVDEKVIERLVIGEKSTTESQQQKTRVFQKGRRKKADPSSILSDYQTPVMIQNRGWGLEEICLTYLSRFPRLIHPLSFVFAENGIPFLTEEDFTRTENRAIYSNIKANAEMGLLLDPDDLLDMLPAPLAGYFEELLILSERQPAAGDEEQISADLALCALRLKGRGLRQIVERLQYLLQEQTEEDERIQALALSQQIQHFSVTIQQIDRALYARSMVGRREVTEAGWFRT